VAGKNFLSITSLPLCSCGGMVVKSPYYSIRRISFFFFSTIQSPSFWKHSHGYPHSEFCRDGGRFLSFPGVALFFFALPRELLLFHWGRLLSPLWVPRKAVFLWSRIRNAPLLCLRITFTLDLRIFFSVKYRFLSFPPKNFFESSPPSDKGDVPAECLPLSPGSKYFHLRNFFHDKGKRRLLSLISLASRSLISLYSQAFTPAFILFLFSPRPT